MRAKKRFGQNFLVDRQILDRLTEALSPTDEEAVLEIGPGRGAWTERILDRISRLVAIEKDRDLIPSLKSRFGVRLDLIERDVLGVDFTELRRERRPDHAGWVVAGNLPYNISKPVCGLLVEKRESIQRAVLMFQKEVGERLTARPGDRAYAALSVWVGLHFEIDRLFDVKPGSFRPAPSVQSTVTSWLPRQDAPEPEESAAVSKLLRSAFHAPRKSLRNNLLRMHPEIAKRLLDTLSDEQQKARPGTIDAGEYLSLSRCLLEDRE
jgi:16S rRNA (adenine1518-N6/adenine1519-N6)-dimethyltransferase